MGYEEGYSGREFGEATRTEGDFVRIVVDEMGWVWGMRDRRGGRVGFKKKGDIHTLLRRLQGRDLLRVLSRERIDFRDQVG